MNNTATEQPPLTIASDLLMDAASNLQAAAAQQRDGLDRELLLAHASDARRLCHHARALHASTQAHDHPTTIRPLDAIRDIGALHIDPHRHIVTVDDRPVQLATKPFALLLMLSSDPTRVFTKAELLEHVWGFKSMGRTRTVDSHASRLRRALDPDRGRFVHNVWGVGYRLLPSS